MSLSAPHEFDGTLQRAQLFLVGLVDRPDEHVAHHSRRRSVVVTTRSAPSSLHPPLGDDADAVKAANDPVTHARRRRCLKSQQGNAREHKGSDELGPTGCEMHGDTSAERMGHDDRRCVELLEHGRHGRGIVGATPTRFGRCGRPESGRIDGDGVESDEDLGEVGVGPPPSRQSDDPRRSGAVTRTQETAPGEGLEHGLKTLAPGRPPAAPLAPTIP